MRTSNKILLSVFLASIIIMIAIQVTLHVKYRNGDVTKYYKPASIRHELREINCISIIGLDNVTIFPSDDPRIETESDTSQKLLFNIQHDTLVISEPSAHSGLASDRRSYQEVNIYLSALKNIIAAYSSINLKGSSDSVKAIPYKLNLISGVDLSINRGEDNVIKPLYFKNFEVRAGSSGIKLHSKAFIEGLSLYLTDANFDDEGATIGRINIQSDNNSVIELHGNNFKKVNLP